MTMARASGFTASPSGRRSPDALAVRLDEDSAVAVGAKDEDAALP
jgi:hypothetical protein